MRGGRVVQYAIAGSAAWLGTLRTHMRVIAAIAPFMCEIAVSAFPEPRARAQTAARSEAVDRFAKLIGEASGRFAIPARWIRAVMRVESDGDEHAISSRGAMGLMQLMPGTWVELSVPLWSRRRPI
jgi:soluble lytic murein transglycosylase-like protein